MFTYFFSATMRQYFVAVSVLLPLILILATSVFSDAQQCTLDAECNGHGVCKEGVCQCSEAGWIGTHCELRTDVSATYGLNGKFRFEFAVLADNSGIAIRQSSKTPNTWFGGIWNVGPDGMTQGDCWMHYFGTKHNTPYILDMYSKSTKTPTEDTQNDLLEYGGWKNDTHWVMQYNRKWDTGDSKDIVFSSVAGTYYRYMWAIGHKQPADRDMGHHGYMGGNTGQFKVDFAGKSFVELTDGIKWPQLYTTMAIALTALLVTTAILRQPCIQNSDLFNHSLGGASLRKPVVYAADTAVFFQDMVDFSLGEMIFIAGYLFVVVAGTVSSSAEYDAVGRGRDYIAGHLLAIQMTLSMLPTSRNSPFLYLLRVPFDHAIKFHRISGRLSIVFGITHFIGMLTKWGRYIRTWYESVG